MNAIDRFEALRQEHAFVVAVFYRGDWCPWCTAYLTDVNNALVPAVRELGGEVVAVTAQLAPEAKAQWGLDYDVLSDADAALAKQLNVFLTPKAEIPFADGDEYQHGMAQPAVIAVDKEGNRLYEWIIIPSEMNMGGAADRPRVESIEQAIRANVQGEPLPTAEVETTDMAYLEAHHPAQFKMVQDYLASLSA